MSAWLGRRAEAAREEILANAVERLARVADGESPQLAVDAVARAELYAITPDARIETVERARRRPADAPAAEVVDAAVAGADERLGGGDEVYRAAHVGA